MKKWPGNVILYVIHTASFLLLAHVASLTWKWFVAPLGLPMISMWGMAGIMTLLGMPKIAGVVRQAAMEAKDTPKHFGVMFCFGYGFVVIGTLISVSIYHWLMLHT